jgi:DNA-binding transcriptional regulator YdaS (Cro superfamily)
MDINQFFSQPEAPSLSAFARELGWNHDQLRQYRKLWRNKRPSAAMCVQLERHSLGAMRCEDIRGDINWVRIPDRRWKWGGRPLVDYAAGLD